jgi:hypothetical protein
MKEDIKEYSKKLTMKFNAGGANRGVYIPVPTARISSHCWSFIFEARGDSG